MKIFKTLAFAFVISMLFISCGKKGIVDECGCYLSLEDAKKDAEKHNKNILFLCTSDGDDYISEEFISSVVQSDEFKNKIGKKYTVFHFDFSQKSYEKTVVLETATKEEQAKAEMRAELMQAGYQFACLLNCQYTPSCFLLTKEGYVISEIIYDDEILEADSFATLISTYDEQADSINSMVAATKKGSVIERVNAIETFYTSTPEVYQPLLLDLAKTIQEIDKNNESGLCGKYIVPAAESTAINLYSKGDVVGAVQTYVAACESPYISADDKQQCYYMAGYILASSGSDDFGLILSYLNYALNAAPESDKIPYLKDAISYYTDLINNNAAAENASEVSNVQQ